MNPLDAASIHSSLLNLQDRICSALSEIDGGHGFREDAWQHTQGGGGRTRTMENSLVFERGGVNFSHVRGDSLPPSASASRPDIAGLPFEAMGISLVMHPYNPFVPTVHFNVRYFSAGDAIWWFGGGFDLTPYYGFDEDCVHWHRTAKAACDPFSPTMYEEFKAWCDRYFYLKHRQEPRGIGGLFFDDFNRFDRATCFSFVETVGQKFIEGYIPIVERRKTHPFSPHHKEFQLYRRGRYVEFNLVFDRGTLFGLQSGGRTESILVSLPPVVNWRYNWTPEPHSEEARLYERYLVPRDWASEEATS